MALGDDYNSGQPDNAGDSDVQRKKSALELILRAQQKPSISPVMSQNQPSQGTESGGRTSVLGNRGSQDASIPRGAMIDTSSESGLGSPNTKHQPSTGWTPTGKAEPEAPYGQTGYTPQASPARPNFPAPRHDVPASSRFQADKNSQTGQEPASFLSATGSGSNADSSNVPSSRFGTSRPRIPSPAETDTEAPNVPWAPPETGKKVLGVGGTSGMPLLGRGSQPARPDVMPTRADFPEKKLPGWEKFLGIAAAPILPGVTEAILTGPRREAQRQYEGAVQDWTLGQQGQERQARIAETEARTRALNNPPPKEGTTPEETTLADLMGGGPGGGPQMNPDTGKPYTRIEAYTKVQQAKTGAAQTAKQPPLSPDNISQINGMHQRQYQILNPGQPLPPELTLRPGATQADYERVKSSLTQISSEAGTQAQREATNTARTQAELDRQEARREKQSETDLQPVYAYDEKTKQTILTTYGEAKAAKMPEVRKVTEDNINKDKQQARQLADAQMNFSDYRMKALQMQGLSGYEIARVGDLIGDSKFKAHFLGLELPSDWANELRQNKDWTALPEDARQAVEAYIGSRGAMIAYVRALNPGTRVNDTMLQTEMKNLPSPTDPPSVQEGKFKRLQRNLDQASKGLVKMRDVNTPAEVRQQMEVMTPQAPNPQPAQPARKGLKQSAVDWLNRKMGAQ